MSPCCSAACRKTATFPAQKRRPSASHLASGCTHPILRTSRSLAAGLERLADVQLPAVRDLGDKAWQPRQPVPPLWLTGDAPGQELRHREAADAGLAHERNISDGAGWPRPR